MFSAEDQVDPTDQPSLASAWRAATEMIEGLMPGVVVELPPGVRDFPPMESWRGRLEKLNQDPGRRSGEKVRYMSPRQAHASAPPGGHQKQAFLQHSALDGVSQGRT
jgi:hypothetical protein